MSDRPRSVDHLLPLKPKVLHILLALADGPRHGYSIMQEVAARTDGHVRVWPAAMYGTLRELEDLDLIAESEKRPSDDDERRRYFALTPLGKRVLSGEVRRLEAIVDHARASRALRNAQEALRSNSQPSVQPTALAASRPGSSGAASDQGRRGTASGRSSCAGPRCIGGDVARPDVGSRHRRRRA